MRSSIFVPASLLAVQLTWRSDSLQTVKFDGLVVRLRCEIIRCLVIRWRTNMWVNNFQISTIFHDRLCLVKFIFICRQSSVLLHGKKQEEKKTQRAGLSKSEAESWKETATCTECNRHFVQVEIDIHSNSTSERLGAYKSKKSNPKGIIELSCVGQSEKVKETETYWVLNYLNVVPRSTVKQRFFGSCGFWGIECWSTYRPIHWLTLGQLSTKMSVESRSSIGQVSTDISVKWCFPVGLVSVTRSTDSPSR